MRERQGGPDFDLVKRRITPAYAGKTKNDTIYDALARDHPRVCGKDPPGGATIPPPPGSPPRMRERPSIPSSPSPTLRITPAYAGKTQPKITPNRFGRDHPRVCGKDDANKELYYALEGSPPRMRERRCRKLLASTRCRDHPRVCGKDSRKMSRRGTILGSPPRMRERRW